MIRNYIIVMWRGMVNKKFYTIINVLCLTVGIAFALLIGIFIYGVLEVNKSLKDVDELFLVQNKIQGEAGGIDFFTPPLLSRVAAEQYPRQFAGYYRFWDRGITISKGEKSLGVGVGVFYRRGARNAEFRRGNAIANYLLLTTYFLLAEQEVNDSLH